ncbi:gluconate 2-dehydrogenase subunit 3 family protein [Pelagicoccus sp. SDUM812002]|uniref:gluconate 2-dehydrogenase subunit 3 family protein n=1 Tax=Pelagicoccus sp. SDUM812002 TaxID=3041266 RepID=UPI00280FD3A7|nr:gluconate 2-dehydrogenase subunit 3 family protein [Pelagicoccus sp. SDUM812002]MDQ8184682.1 gluconate 2-dehydrogenase subunit 3 family protein [Pelagicoccus sp. SDUM812002]
MSTFQKDQKNGYGIDRREAIKRAALILGAALSSTTITGSLYADRAKLGTGPDWTPKYLDSSQAKTVSLAAELILPKSDTPGAIDVGVPQFIDLIYGEYMSDEERERFELGLAGLKQAGFDSAEQSKQIAALKAPSRTLRSFIRQLRELTITGFFTSEEVAKTMLRYDPVPGKYNGCVSVDEVGNVLMSEH